MPEPDIAILLTGSARVVADRLGAAVDEAGLVGMRTSFGFVIRALNQGPRTLTELAELLGVTKQAAIKVVDEMETRGFLQRTADQHDRRAKVIALTEKGAQVRRTALAASDRIEADLRADLGDADVDALRRALIRLLERAGVGADAAAGRSRALW